MFGKKKPVDDGMYRYLFWCDNCNRSQQVAILKGMLVTEKQPPLCANCGCDKLRPNGHGSLLDTFVIGSSL